MNVPPRNGDRPTDQPVVLKGPEPARTRETRFGSVIVANRPQDPERDSRALLSTRPTSSPIRPPASSSANRDIKPSESRLPPPRAPAPLDSRDRDRDTRPPILNGRDIDKYRNDRRDLPPPRSPPRRDYSPPITARRRGSFDGEDFRMLNLNDRDRDPRGPPYRPPPPSPPRRYVSPLPARRVSDYVPPPSYERDWPRSGGGGSTVDARRGPAWSGDDREPYRSDVSDRDRLDRPYERDRYPDYPNAPRRDDSSNDRPRPYASRDSSPIRRGPDDPYPRGRPPPSELYPRGASATASYPATYSGRPRSRSPPPRGPPPLRPPPPTSSLGRVHARSPSPARGRGRSPPPLSSRYPPPSSSSSGPHPESEMARAAKRARLEKDEPRRASGPGFSSPPRALPLPSSSLGPRLSNSDRPPPPLSSYRDGDRDSVGRGRPSGLPSSYNDRDDRVGPSRDVGRRPLSPPRGAGPTYRGRSPSPPRGFRPGGDRDRERDRDGPRDRGFYSPPRRPNSPRYAPSSGSWGDRDGDRDRDRGRFGPR